MTAVFDASALLALVYVEPGVERVRESLRRGATISVVNWAETLSRMADRGEDGDASTGRIERLVAATGWLTIAPFDEDAAAATARLRMPTRHLGLSLADRACLALARRHRLPVLTTDRAWRSLRISVKIEVIR